MNFLFTSGFEHLPQSFGGLTSNTHEIALELTQRGHIASVAANLNESDWLGIRTRLLGRLFGKGRFHDNTMGYPAYRRWGLNSCLEEIAEHIRPDVAVIQASHHIEAARILERMGIPTILYFHDVLFDELDGDPRGLEKTLFMSNSRFTAEKYKERFGIVSGIIPPFFRSDRYKTNTSRSNVTFVNPKPQKGLELVKDLVAALPDIPFCFQESWELVPEEWYALEAFAQKHPNLSLRPRTTNMKDVYRHAKLVLVPSQLEEAWGRVATEAHFSGIPVIASNTGGLPEAVGHGGILLEPTDVRAWTATLRRAWDDSEFYNSLSKSALQHSRNMQIDPTVQLNLWLEVARLAVEINAALRPPEFRRLSASF